MSPRIRILRRRARAVLAGLAPLLLRPLLALLRASLRVDLIGGAELRAHARTAGAPIAPIAYAATRAWRLRSWDRPVIPTPFARIEVEIGAPITVPADGEAALLARLRDELQAQLNGLTYRVDARLGWRGDAVPAPPVDGLPS